MSKECKPFCLYKFLTMLPDAQRQRAALTARNEGNGVLFKIRNDPRVTRVGARLRRWSLDELPQLVNVLLGQMSLVGPRPALPEEAARYVDYVSRRLAVRPGITGLCQVRGRSNRPCEEAVWLGVSILRVLGALAYLQLTPKTYSASASVYVPPTAAGQGNNQLANSRTSGAAVNLDTEAVVVKSGQVAQIAAKTLNSPLSPGALAAQVTVAVPPNSEVLQISCSAGNPLAAADCAQAFAKAYLQNRDTQAAQSISAQLKALQSKIAGLQKTAAGLSAQIASLPSSAPSRASAQTELNADNSEHTQLSNQVAALTAASAANSGGSVITNAVPPAASNPATPKKKIVLPSGAVAGLLIGLALAFLADRRDKRIRGAH